MAHMKKSKLREEAPDPRLTFVMTWKAVPVSKPETPHIMVFRFKTNEAREAHDLSQALTYKVTSCKAYHHVVRFNPHSTDYPFIAYQAMDGTELHMESAYEALGGRIPHWGGFSSKIWLDEKGEEIIDW